MAEDRKKPIDGTQEKPLNENETFQLYSGKSFREKLKYIRDNITVEPLLAGLIISSVVSGFAMTNLNLDKACRVNLNFGDEVCDALIKSSNIGNYSSYEKEVQKLISSIGIWMSILRTALPCIIIMFLGAWSDRTGKRKLGILLPICGEFMASISNLVNVYYFYEIPVQITMFFETLFTSITGGWVTMFLGVFSYISDITSEESRTFRVGLVNFCMTCGVPIGIGLSGIMLQNLGYYGIFSLTAVLFTLVFLYGILSLKESESWLRDKGLSVPERTKSGVSFFNLSHVVDTVAVAFRKRSSNRRVKVLLTLFTVFILYGPTMSEHNVFYLFVRNRLNWDMVKYSLFISYAIVLHAIGAMFSITVLSKKLQFDDSLLCLISVSSKFVAAIWTAFVTTDIEMYLAPVADFLNATTFTSLRSIVSKLVEKQETAKMNSLFSLTETLASLMFHPFYSWLYMKTLAVLPGAVFLTSAALVVPAACILVTFYIQHRLALRNARKLALEAEENKEEKKPGPLQNLPIVNNNINNAELDNKASQDDDGIPNNAKT